MLRSMTGFGRAEAAGKSYTYTVEVKTVNHRYLDMVIRLPRFHSPLEEKIRTLVSGYLHRGRVEVYVQAAPGEGRSRRVKVDKEMALAYYNAIRELKEFLGKEEDFPLPELVRLPEVLLIEEEEADLEEEWRSLAPAVEEALRAVVAMREQEGSRLAEDISRRLERVEELRRQIETRTPLVVEEYRVKLQQRLEGLLGETELDPARLAAEVAIFAERCNIDEELVRLHSHVQQMRGLLTAVEPVGRKMDFLLQEMHREVNTIGAKASDLTITQLVVETKGELEKIREQVQNIE